MMAENDNTAWSSHERAFIARAKDEQIVEIEGIGDEEDETENLLSTTITGEQHII